MNQKISYILKHDRFPLSKMDKISLGVIFTLLIGLAIGAITLVQGITGQFIIVLVTALLCVAVYRGYVSSLAFKRIGTGFNAEKNKMLIVYCLGGLNFKPFRDKDHDEVFVCFIHDQKTNDRQEIYLIAKDQYVLIHSNKEKASEDESGGIDFVDRIGATIYRTARHYTSKNFVQL